MLQYRYLEWMTTWEATQEAISSMYLSQTDFFPPEIVVIFSILRAGNYIYRIYTLRCITFLK